MRKVVIFCDIQNTAYITAWNLVFANNTINNHKTKNNV